MQPEWHFKRYAPGDTYRNSTTDAFFDNDAVSDPGKALVREGIQNSLDAHKIHPSRPAMVQISLLSQESASTWEEVEKLFGTVWPHYRAERSGLRPDEIPRNGERSTTLVFEDMNTTGLLGDTEEWSEPDKCNRNDFFNFFRAEALTHKSTGDRGSRGVGKATFFQASRVKTLFGLTKRHGDPRLLLMGRSILRPHKLGDDHHQGDGYFGIESSLTPGFIVPIEDDQFIEEFVKTFCLVRREESGLSTVVPWLYEDIDETTIVRAVCENYFFTILNCGLEVFLQLPEAKVILDRESISLEVKKDPELKRMWPTIELAEWATQGNADAERHILNTHPGSGAYTWSKSLFPEGLLDMLRDKLQRRERFTLRVQVPVRSRKTAVRNSHFDVYITADDSENASVQAFIREDILIADVRPRPMRDGIHGLVVINHAPLATFLRLAENPSHTQWQYSRVKKDYIQAASLINFVVNSVRGICNLAATVNREEDKRLLSDIFPIPGDGNGNNGGTNGNGGGSHPSVLRINSVKGGFSVTPGQQVLQPGDRIKIEVAYARSRGDAFTRYSATDFQVDQEPIILEVEGVEITEGVDNRIIASITSTQHRITVTGFDENRDIRVRADRIGGTDAAKPD